MISLASCETMDLFEKNVAIPQHAWESRLKPELQFEIKDTSASYRIFFVIRHTDAYEYNNIWVNLTSTSPGDTVSVSQKFEFQLATYDKWTGSGIDDIFEHRIQLYRQPVKFKNKGVYKVRLEQLMRDDPLKNILNVGLRVEKAQR
jgi:gliding motility-associated lipoprotein GldH